MLDPVITQVPNWWSDGKGRGQRPSEVDAAGHSVFQLGITKENKDSRNVRVTSSVENNIRSQDGDGSH